MSVYRHDMGSRIRFSLACGLAMNCSVTLAQPDSAGRACQLDEQDQKMLDSVNQARSQARQCGDEAFDKAQPLAWSCRLEAAAQTHNQAMVEQDFFGHAGPDGKQVSDRVSDAGYTWRAVGENIAAGQPTVEQVVDGWLQSPGHCRNIMKPEFEEMGAARSEGDGGLRAPYWTQVFARPR